MNDSNRTLLAELAAVAALSTTVDATVTVVRTDGKTFTGTIAHHPTDPDLFVIKTGRRGRPASIHPDDVDAVIYEN